MLLSVSITSFQPDIKKATLGQRTGAGVQTVDLDLSSASSSLFIHNYFTTLEGIDRYFQLAKWEGKRRGGGRGEAKAGIRLCCFLLLIWTYTIFFSQAEDKPDSCGGSLCLLRRHSSLLGLKNQCERCSDQCFDSFALLQIVNTKMTNFYGKISSRTTLRLVLQPLANRAS